MKGVVFLGDRKLELREFPDPTPGPRDVILAIKASGMCGSDLHNYRAPANPGGAVTGGIKRAAGVIAGHEPCGVVAAAGHRHRAVQGVRGLACPFLGGRRATPARHAMLIAFNVSASGVRIRSGRCHRTSS
jgi:threonine dehydrogenase-like Zn-dependent dehydrogenase